MPNLSPINALRSGQWAKLICGASYQHLPSIRNLVFVYTLAGADCFDVAADPGVVTVAREAMDAARAINPDRSPWLMVSINNGEDLHFRKAQFNPQVCVPDCGVPCQKVCPTDAIDPTGVITDRCYGCGRCLSVCPVGIIETREQVYNWRDLVDLPIDALEIHTTTDRIGEFAQLWQELAPWIRRLRLVAVSFPDHADLEANLRQLLAVMNPPPQHLLWQTDGRPMSGDIGAGTTRQAIRLGEKVLNMNLPGFVQLAGGTNATTVSKLQGLPVNGIAYGSYGRSLLADLFDRLPEGAKIEHFPLVLEEALDRARTLVIPLKNLHNINSYKPYVGHFA
ncbi:MAG: 4Fe-4S ferredoxin [Cyanobacteria bacterium M5B4]|nr:MAG: 4Fe-4S ferredoxin [Cyanobacteria bacterium M5B4]